MSLLVEYPGLWVSLFKDFGDASQLFYLGLPQNMGLIYITHMSRKQKQVYRGLLLKIFNLCFETV